MARLKAVTRALLKTAKWGKKESPAARLKRAARIKASRKSGRDYVGSATGYYRNTKGKRTLGGK